MNEAVNQLELAIRSLCRAIRDVQDVNESEKNSDILRKIELKQAELRELFNQINLQ